jgi:signal transduction histidine kinase
VDRFRSRGPLAVDCLLAVVFAIVGVMSVFGQGLETPEGEVYDEPGLVAAVTAALTCLPIAIRRRAPLSAQTIGIAAIFVHLLAGWPEGLLPFAVFFLTYTVGARCQLRPAIVGLAIPAVAVVALWFRDVPGLEGFGVLGVLAQFIAVWAIGVAIRSRRAATEARVREAEERAQAEGQRAARVLAEERLRIAQELHDVVAHSMSVIAVQAGVGAHVIDERPDEARAALAAISTTSRQALAEMRRMLGMLRNSDGSRASASAPAPGLVDLPSLVDDVRAAGVPASLHVEGHADSVHSGVELSAYRVVQEALTNVIKHAGSPTRVDVTVRHEPGVLAVEVRDDGRGLAARSRNGGADDEGPGHGLVGMRERVELWGGELSVGPCPGGGYRVAATLPYGDPE